jgi:predicted HTH transcriptional regulator
MSKVPKHAAMTLKELRDLVALGEGVELEFKQSLPSDLGKEICAIANAIG